MPAITEDGIAIMAIVAADTNLTARKGVRYSLEKYLTPSSRKKEVHYENEKELGNWPTTGFIGAGLLLVFYEVSKSGCGCATTDCDRAV